MNPFATLGQPLARRPGDFIPEDEGPQKPVRQYTRRQRPNAFPYRPNPWKLSGADCEMLTLLADGEEPEAIAEVLNIQPGTLKTRIHRACEAAGARNRLQLVVMWDRFNRSAS